MKKILQNQKWIRHSQNKASDELFKRKRKKIKRIRYKYSKTKNLKTHEITVPNNYSFIDNTEELIEHFDDANEYTKKSFQLNFNFANIENLTPDAIALLVAKIRDQQFHCGNNITGNIPEKEDAALLFKQSGFYSHVKSAHIDLSEELLIHKVTRQKVQNDVAKDAALLAVRHSFGKEVKFAPLYVILIECMANTNNHAGFSKKGFYDWWLFVYRKPNTNITTFTMIDLGVGIFESLPVKSYIKRLLKTVKLKSNVDLVPKLLNGEIYSRTLKGERGRGLPLINENARNEHFGRFFIISNDVYIDLKKNVYTKLSKDFSGTFIYFELIAKRTL